MGVDVISGPGKEQEVPDLSVLEAEMPKDVVAPGICRGSDPAKTQPRPRRDRTDVQVRADPRNGEFAMLDSHVGVVDR